MNKTAVKLTLGFLMILGGALLGLGLIFNYSQPFDSKYLLAALLSVFALSSILVLVLVQGFTCPLDEIVDVARQLARGSWQARVKYPPRDELGEIASSLNNLSLKIRETVNELAENKGSLEAVLRTMESGVLLVDSDGQVVLVNRAAEKILGILQQDVQGKSQVEALQNFSLSTLISIVLSEWQPQREEISLFYPEERVLEVTAAPVWGEDGKEYGVVVVLYDLTEIRRLERVRAEFVANVSHELKTPVTSIKGFAETLLDGALYNHRSAEEFVNIINEEADRLSSLVGDLLDLSRIESREVKPRFVSLELTTAMKEIIDKLRPQFRKKGLNIEAVLPKETVIVQADTELIQQVLENLLDNSLKYTPEGGKVTVRLLPSQDEVAVVIEDTGIGIPAEDLPRLFERFYRVDKARSRKLGGTGLGLAIVKHIINAHGGCVWAESEPGRGSSFYFSLPVDKIGGAGEYGR